MIQSYCVFRYALYTLPPLIFALVCAVMVPSLFCMLAIETALTVPWVNNLFPALLYSVSWHRSHEKHPSFIDYHTPQAPPPAATEGESPHQPLAQHDHMVAFYHQQSLNVLDEFNHEVFIPARWRKLVYGYVIGVGVLMFVVCAVGAIGKMTFKDIRGPLEIGCSGWVIME